MPALAAVRRLARSSSKSKILPHNMCCKGAGIDHDPGTFFYLELVDEMRFAVCKQSPPHAATSVERGLARVKK